MCESDLVAGTGGSHSDSQDEKPEMAREQLPVRRFVLGMIEQLQAQNAARLAGAGTLQGFAGRDLLDQWWEQLRKAELPGNLRTLPDITSDDVLTFTAEHRVSLYLVAPTAVAAAFLAAPDHATVRRILSDKRALILSECREILLKCDQLSTVKYRDGALQAVAALEADLFMPAQAMAATLLDGMVQLNMLDYSLSDAAKRHSGESIKDMQHRVENLDVWGGYVATALWSAFEHYYPEERHSRPQLFLTTCHYSRP